MSASLQDPPVNDQLGDPCRNVVRAVSPIPATSVVSSSQFPTLGSVVTETIKTTSRQLQPVITRKNDQRLLSLTPLGHLSHGKLTPETQLLLRYTTRIGLDLTMHNSCTQRMRSCNLSNVSSFHHFATVDIEVMEWLHTPKTRHFDG